MSVPDDGVAVDQSDGLEACSGDCLQRGSKESPGCRRTKKNTGTCHHTRLSGNRVLLRTCHDKGRRNGRACWIKSQHPKKILTQTTDGKARPRDMVVWRALARTPAPSTQRSIRPDRIKTAADWPLQPGRQRRISAFLERRRKPNKTTPRLGKSQREKAWVLGAEPPIGFCTAKGTEGTSSHPIQAGVGAEKSL